MTFPQVVHELTEVGVESYFVDLAAGRKTYYMARRQRVHGSDDPQAGPRCRGVFGLWMVAAIRGAQADAIRYPEFVQQSTAAGVVGYWAFLAGKKVLYLGRKGESHVEGFPRAKDQCGSTYFPICTGPSFLYCIAGVPVMAAKVCVAAPDRVSRYDSPLRTGSWKVESPLLKTVFPCASMTSTF